MATHRLPILGHATVPDDSAEVFLQPQSLIATNNIFDGLIFTFNDTATRDSLHGRFEVPENYVDGANIVIVWSSPAIAGDVEWEFDYRPVGGDDIESLDQATFLQNVGSNDDAPSAIHERMEFVLALTDGNFAANDTVQWALSRDGTDAGDTIGDIVYLVALLFEYDD